VVAGATRGRAGAALLVVAATLLGGAGMQRALDGAVHSPLSVAARRYTPGTAVGTLVDDPSGPRFAVRALLRTATFDGRDAGGRTLLAVASGDAASRLRVLEAGDRITVIGTLGPLDGYDARARWHHAVARLRVDDLVDFTGPTDPVLRAANALRRAVLRGAVGLPSTERALLEGFLLGDTRSIPESVVDDFRASGLGHLLAVSGANVAFVLALAAPVLRRLGLTARLAGGITVLVVFGAMTRWEPSVLRAVAMAGLVMLATYLGRPASAARVLVVAATLLLLADPFLVHSVGFLLSGAACAGIVTLSSRIAARLPGPQPLREAVGVTLGAQLGVTPVLLPVFGTVPLVALLANLLAAPVVGPLTVWGLLAGVVGGVLGPDVARVLQLPTLALLGWVRTVASLAARLPIAIDTRAAWGIAALAVAAAAVGRLRSRGGVRGGREGPGAALPGAA
ncbi:MAG: ComEC/Rec2 family competence protein, partial [Actinobacteria bacterium]|nr:ComEC/Rec2 family competence protein [Actinomycetota bacterium]